MIECKICKKLNYFKVCNSCIIHTNTEEYAAVLHWVKHEGCSLQCPEYIEAERVSEQYMKDIGLLK